MYKFQALSCYWNVQLILVSQLLEQTQSGVSPEVNLWPDYIKW